MEANEKQKASVGGVKKYTGSCHCGAVRFEADVDLGNGAIRCNCTICTKTAWFGALVKPNAFALLSGEENLSSYEWASKTSRRYFCKHCSVNCFARGYLEQVGGDYVSLNVNCFDEVELQDLKVAHWDGRHNNWEAGPRPAPWPIFAP